MFITLFDILKGIFIGIISISVGIFIVPINLFLYDYIEKFGGFTYLVLLTIAYTLAYCWPLLILLSLLWFSNLFYQRYISFPR